jgi:hypothetical protein
MNEQIPACWNCKGLGYVIEFDTGIEERCGDCDGTGKENKSSISAVHGVLLEGEYYPSKDDGNVKFTINENGSFTVEEVVMGIDDELLIIRNWWQEQRRWAPAGVAIVGTICSLGGAGSSFLARLIGTVLLLAAGWWYGQQQLAVQDK